VALKELMASLGLGQPELLIDPPAVQKGRVDSGTFWLWLNSLTVDGPRIFSGRERRFVLASISNRQIPLRG
jgi:hypothetical protein